MRARALQALLGSSRPEVGPTPSLGPTTSLGPPLFPGLDPAALRSGEVSFHHARTALGDVGRAGVIARAPMEAVRATLLDVDRWSAFLPYVTESRAAGVKDAGWTGEITLTTKGVTTRLGLDWWSEGDDIAFVLEGRGGALRAGQGRWTVRPWEEDWSATLLVLDVGLDALPWVPGFARKLAAGRGLPTTARCMAREAERRQA